MAPKRKAASKTKKAEQIIEETAMTNITVRRPVKNTKDEREEISSPKESVLGNSPFMDATMVIEKIPDSLGQHMSNTEFEEDMGCEESDTKFILKKNISTKVTKSELNKQASEDGKVSKKPRKRAVSEDRTKKIKEDAQTIKMEEKVVSSKNKKRHVGKELSDSHEPQKRNRRAASVDILTKNSEPKKLRKGIIVEPNQQIVVSLDSLDNPTPENPSTESLAVVPKKNRKANNKAVVETVDDKPPKNSDKKESKILEKPKKMGKNTKKAITDEKEKVSKEQSDEMLDVEDDLEETPKQVISRGRGKKQVIQKNTSEESTGKIDTDYSDIKSPPEEFTVEQDKKNIRSRGKRQVVQKPMIYSDKSSEEEICETYDYEIDKNTEMKSKPNKKEHGSSEEKNLKLAEDSSENIPKQINSGSRGGKGQTKQKGVSKSSEESSGKNNTDDSDIAKSPEKKSKRIAKQKESNTGLETKTSKLKGRKVKKDDFEEKVISDNDVNVKTGEVPTDILADSPESGKNVPIVVKRKANAKRAKK